MLNDWHWFKVFCSIGLKHKIRLIDKIVEVRVMTIE